MSSAAKTTIALYRKEIKFWKAVQHLLVPFSPFIPRCTKWEKWVRTHIETLKKETNRLQKYLDSRVKQYQQKDREIEAIRFTGNDDNIEVIRRFAGARGKLLFEDP